MSGWFKQPNTLLLDCKQNVRGSMGAICKSSIPAYVLEWVGQWSVTLCRITDRLSLSLSRTLSLSVCLILFHNIMEQLEDMHILKILTYKVREQHPLKHINGGKSVWLKGRSLNTNPIIVFHQSFYQHNIYNFCFCFDQLSSLSLSLSMAACNLQ